MGKAKRRGKPGEYEISGDLRRIVPLKDGYCYIHDLKGKLHHVKVSSEEFNSLVDSMRERLGAAKIAAELERVNVFEAVRDE